MVIAAAIVVVIAAVAIIGYMVARTPPDVPAPQPGVSSVVVGRDTHTVSDKTLCGRVCSTLPAHVVNTHRYRFLVSQWTRAEIKERNIPVTAEIRRRAKQVPEISRKAKTATGSVEETAESMALAQRWREDAEEQAKPPSAAELDKATEISRADAGKPDRWIADVIRVTPEQARRIDAALEESRGDLGVAVFQQLQREPKQLTVTAENRAGGLYAKLRELTGDDSGKIVHVDDGENVIIAQFHEFAPRGRNAEEMAALRKELSERMRDERMQQAVMDSRSAFERKWRERTQCQKGWPSQLCGK